jgi:hypothetical protein
VNPLEIRNIPPILAGKILPSPGQQGRLFVSIDFIYSQLALMKGVAGRWPEEKADSTTSKGRYPKKKENPSPSTGEGQGGGEMRPLSIQRA